MACQTCQSHSRSLLRLALRPGGSALAPAYLRRSIAPAAAAAAGEQASMHETTRMGVRNFSVSSKRHFFSRMKQTYRVLGASEHLFKICSKPADYRITDHERKNDLVKRRDDGEEIGSSTTPENVWHKTFGLQPSFSTWSHVTMLHLHIIHARLRCFAYQDYRDWSQQMIDHFFFECERKMHLDHNITSSALRQRYLKDIFVQWRGLLLAYDEGIIKGDAVLASAIWRNLFRGNADVDPRALVAIVGWMRASLLALEAAADDVVPNVAAEVLQKPVNTFWTRLEAPFLSDQVAFPPVVEEKIKEVEPENLIPPI